MGYLKTEKSDVYYEDSADSYPEVKDKPVVLFLNGWALSARYWTPVIEELTPDYRCVTLDQSGTGRTKLISSLHDYTIPYFADEVSAVIDHLNLARHKHLHLVGHSMGSMVTTEIHHRYPDECISVTIIACGIFDYNWMQMQLLSWFVESSMNFKWIFNLSPFKSGLIEKATTKPISQEYADIIVEDFINTNTEAASQVGTLSLDKHALDVYTAQALAIQTPLLLCVGKDDKTIPPEGMETLYEKRQQHSSLSTRLIQYDDIGHLPMLETTKEFAAALREHFTFSESQVSDLKPA
jgi:pimeloyl-ACP methyl ester carboxylesterase